MQKFLFEKNIKYQKAVWNMTEAQKERLSLKKLAEMRTIKTNYELESLRKDGFIPGHIDDNIFEIYEKKRDELMEKPKELIPLNANSEQQILWN